MGRSGYSDSCDGWALIRWRGAVASAIRGKRGQSFLRELAAAMDAMPEKKLIDQSFSDQGAYCTLGVIGAARGVDMPATPDLEDWDGEEALRGKAASALSIPESLAAEVMYLNDDGWYDETPEHRWKRMREWVAAEIRPELSAKAGGVVA